MVLIEIKPMREIGPYPQRATGATQARPTVRWLHRRRVRVDARLPDPKTSCNPASRAKES
jgi:hypothetical protein